MTWLIARRAALEALQDRLSLLVGLFFAVVVPLGLLVLVVRPLAGPASAGPALGARLRLQPAGGRRAARRSRPWASPPASSPAKRSAAC